MIDIENWTDLEIADGRYTILELIGEGSMGVVYLAHDARLKCEVVVKCPRIPDSSGEGPEVLERFNREIRSLVSLSHPHIVRITDVGSHDGSPFVVMQYLSGGTLRDRMEHDSRSGPRPMPPRTLFDWLLEVAKALDFIHGQNYVHRDVKPANILFDRFGNAFLSDFGIIKALVHEAETRAQSQLTAPGSLLGTPNYVAPEIVMGLPYDGRSDQYSLAMTLHEVLTGSNCMEGPSASATLVNQTTVVPPALADLIPGIPAGLSDAIQCALSKDAADRFEDCVTFAKEVLANIPAQDSAATVPIAGLALESRGKPGDVRCPACEAPLELSREHAGERVRCPRCECIAAIHISKSDTLILNQIAPPSRPWAHKSLDSSGTYPTGMGVGRPAGGARTGQSGTGTNAQMTPAAKRLDAMRRLGIYALLGLVTISAALSIRRELISDARSSTHRLVAKPPEGANSDGTRELGSVDGSFAPPGTGHAGIVEITIAFGTEKEKWLKDAKTAFEQTPAGKRVKIKLVGMGSLEGATAILRRAGDPKQETIHVWSPASSVARDVLETKWRERYRDSSPIAHADNLVLTPMVFVMWKDRYDAFIKKYNKVDFSTLARAMDEPGGWATIAQKPEWGQFKFGHTDPEQSNSGLLAVVLTAYEHARKPHSLTVEDVTQSQFVAWLTRFEREVTPHAKVLNHSTGSLMKEMVLRGPSDLDCLMAYENLAIDYLNDARERWGELYVTYPEPNIWNEHPYYVLNVPWSNERQREAATEFANFLMSEPIQLKALEHGFRTGSLEISPKLAYSLLVRNAKSGLKIEPGTISESPRASVVEALLRWFTAHPRTRENSSSSSP